jgi:ketosteroid isomerase-like protein
VERYALAVDERRAADVAALFCEDGLLVVPRPPASLAPVAERRGRGAIEEAMTGLSRYPATLHAVVGHVVDVAGDEAEGTTSCLAHHVTGPPRARRDVVWSIHYRDSYRREAAGWRIATRHLHLRWIEDRPVRQLG